MHILGTDKHEQVQNKTWQYARTGQLLGKFVLRPFCAAVSEILRWGVAMTATCMHCGGACRLTNGQEVYPHRTDLYPKLFFVCDHCDAWVGCHDGTDQPLGHAANKATRNARSKLHDLRFDPLWKGQSDSKALRSASYRFLAKALGIEPHECHTGMFTIERCRDAWRALRGQTPETIRQWNDARRSFAEEALTDRKGRRRDKRRRRASHDDTPGTTGKDFCPDRGALNEVQESTFVSDQSETAVG